MAYDNDRDTFSYEHIGQTSPSELSAISGACDRYMGRTALFFLGHPDTRRWWRRVLGQAMPDVVQYALCFDDAGADEAILQKAASLRAEWDAVNERNYLREQLEQRLFGE